MAILELTTEERITLREFLVGRFDLDELHTLAFDMGIDHQNIPHTTKIQFAPALIQHAQNRELLPKLLQAAIKERPNTLEIEIIYQRLKGESPSLTPKYEKQRSCPTPPAPPRYFGGRDVPLTAIADKLKNGQTTTIVALQGLGGIGKTTLARKLADELYKQKVFRAVLWANITSTPQPLDLLQNWAAYADPDFQPGDRPLPGLALHIKAMLEEVIADKCQVCEPSRTLVVLDDVWDNPQSLSTARLLCEACPADATILITSRSYSAATDLGAKVQHLDKLVGDETLAMLNQYLPDSDPALLRELGQLLGGHPLALTLAAKRVLKAENQTKALSSHLADYHKKLPRGVEFKQLKLDQGLGREDNLTLVLSYSYQELEPADQNRFRALGALAYNQPFDKPMLAALWQLDDTGELETACDTLRLLSLLELDYTYADNNKEGDQEDGWYRLHPLLQTYARALFQATKADQEVTARYQKYVVEEITEQFWKLPPEEWSRQLTPYLPHVQAVGASLVQQVQADNSDSVELRSESNYAGQKEASLKLALLFSLNVSNYLANRREVKQMDWLEMGLDVSTKLNDQKHEARFLIAIGRTYTALGEQRKALDYYNQALPIAQAIGNKSNEAAILNRPNMSEAVTRGKVVNVCSKIVFTSSISIILPLLALLI